jgi:hypothetical protein
MRFWKYPSREMCDMRNTAYTTLTMSSIRNISDA